MGSHPSPIRKPYSRKVSTVMVSPNTTGPIIPAAANRVNLRPDITAPSYSTNVCNIQYNTSGSFACPVGHPGSSIIFRGPADEYQRRGCEHGERSLRCVQDVADRFRRRRTL